MVGRGFVSEVGCLCYWSFLLLGILMVLIDSVNVGNSGGVLNGMDLGDKVIDGKVR